VKKILLTQDKVALVDDEDYNKLNEHWWYAKKTEYTWYAVRKKSIYENISGPRMIYMHRVILNAKKNEICDHIDRNGLNNQRNNLRIVSFSESAMNRRIRVDNVSEFKNVSFTGVDWRVDITINGIRKYLGCFTTPEKAAEVCQSYLEKYGE